MPRYAADLARTETNLAELQPPEEALRSYQAARTLKDRLARDYPGVPDYAAGLARTYFNLALFQVAIKQEADAVKSYEAARTLLEPVVREPGLRTAGFPDCRTT